uniref:Putative secreted protein n=2 Tax=Ixodes ricinus TaxID=34613 RepID=A0A147BD86_IXORI
MALLANLVQLWLLFVLNVHPGRCINCYTCSSLNGSDPNCHDPLNPAYTRYSTDCTVPKEKHIGEFPAHFCVKVVGRTVETNIEMVIRICSLETMDNSCGVFRYEETVLQGCILTCNSNGCNVATPLMPSVSAPWVAGLFLLAALVPSTSQSALHTGVLIG